MSRGDDIPWQNPTPLACQAQRGLGLSPVGANFRSPEPFGPGGTNESEVGEIPTLSRNCIEIARFLKSGRLSYISKYPTSEEGRAFRCSLGDHPKVRIIPPSTLEGVFYVQK